MHHFSEALLTPPTSGCEHSAHGKSENLRPLAPPPGTKHRQAPPFQYVLWIPLRRSSLPFPNQDWTFAQFRRLVSKADTRSSASRGEIHERPIREVYPIAGASRSGPCSESFARRSRRAGIVVSCTPSSI